MERVTADMRVWERLGVPESVVVMLCSHLLATKEKTRAYVDLYLCCPREPSWEDIIRVLYDCDEMAAAREAKPFHHQNGK